MCKIHIVEWLSVVSQKDWKKKGISRKKYLESYQGLLFYKQGKPTFKLYMQCPIDDGFVNSLIKEYQDYCDIKKGKKNSVIINVTTPYPATSSTKDIAIDFASALVEFLKQA